MRFSLLDHGRRVWNDTWQCVLGTGPAGVNLLNGVLLRVEEGL